MEDIKVLEALAFIGVRVRVSPGLPFNLEGRMMKWQPCTVQIRVGLKSSCRFKSYYAHHYKGSLAESGLRRMIGNHVGVKSHESSNLSTSAIFIFACIF